MSASVPAGVPPRVMGIYTGVTQPVAGNANARRAASAAVASTSSLTRRGGRGGRGSYPGQPSRGLPITNLERQFTLVILAAPVSLFT